MVPYGEATTDLFLLGSPGILKGVKSLRATESATFNTTKVLRAFDKCPTSPVGRRGWELKSSSFQPSINQPSVIYNRQYTGHALDQMQGRGIFPSLVENTITSSSRKFGKSINTFAYYDNVNNITIITNSKSGKVITATFGEIGQ